MGRSLRLGIIRTTQQWRALCEAIRKVLARLRQRTPVAKSTALKVLRRFAGLHPIDASRQRTDRRYKIAVTPTAEPPPIKLPGIGWMPV